MARTARLTVCLAVLFVAAQAAMAAGVRVTAERVNLRSNASTDSQILMTVSKGTVLQMVGREGDWLRVIVPGGGGAAGYIHSAICELTSESAPAVGSAAVAPAPYPDAPAPASRFAAAASLDPAPVASLPAAETSRAARFGLRGGWMRPTQSYMYDPAVWGSFMQLIGSDLDFAMSGRGLWVGAALATPLSDALSIQLEAAVSRQELEYVSEVGGYTQRWRMDRAEVPLLLVAAWGRGSVRPLLATGPSFEYRRPAEALDAPLDDDDALECPPPPSTWSTGWVLSAGFELGRRLTLEGRYRFDLSAAKDSLPGVSSRARSLTFTTGVWF